MSLSQETLVELMALADGDLERFHELDEAFHRAFCSAADLGGVGHDR